LGVFGAIILTAAMMTPALASSQSKSGTISCGSSQKHSFTRAEFNDMGIVYPPGKSTFWFQDYSDGQWHIADIQGNDFGGHWSAYGYDLLDSSQTYAYCSRYL
jgi:hypothetical protein